MDEIDTPPVHDLHPDEDIKVTPVGTTRPIATSRLRRSPPKTDIRQSEQADASAAQVFVEPKEGGRKFVFAPFDLREAGRLLKTIREFNRVTAGEIASAVYLGRRHVDSEFIENFEEGRVQDTDHRGITQILAKVIQAAERCIDSEDDGIKKMKEILRQREEEAAWMTTLIYPHIIFGAETVLPFNRQIQYLRLSTGMSQREFAKKAGIGKVTLWSFEKGYRIPQQNVLELLIITAGLDSNRRPAQYLRMQRENLAEKRQEKKPEVKSFEYLQQCTLGELIRYLRLLKGVSMTQLGKVIGYSKSGVSAIERHAPIRGDAIEPLISWLGLPSDSPLTEIIVRKYKNPQDIIPVDTLKQALGERYLFKEHFREIIPPSLSTYEKGILKKLATFGSLGEKIRFLRENVLKLSQNKLAQLIGVDESTIGELELGQRQARLYIIFRIINGGYSINHPIMWYFLDPLMDQAAGDESSDYEE